MKTVIELSDLNAKGTQVFDDYFIESAFSHVSTELLQFLIKLIFVLTLIVSLYFRVLRTRQGQ